MSLSRIALWRWAASLEAQRSLAERRPLVSSRASRVRGSVACTDTRGLRHGAALVSRRDWLRGTAALPLVPVLRWLPGGDARCLVVLELQGGNDGLATLIPTDARALERARPQLASVRQGALPVGGGFALHPALAGIHRLVRDGHAAVVQGVGYPNPDRSHFRSRDIWHSADPGYTERGATRTGWLGRAADWLAERGAALPGLSVGSLEVPLMLKAQRVVVPALERVEDYQVIVDPAGGKGDERRARLAGLTAVAPEGDLQAFLGETARHALQGAEQLRAALGRYRPKAEYPDSDLGRALRIVGSLIASRFGTRLMHVAYGGFDTHAQQLPVHDGLLRQLSLAVSALLDDLRAHRQLERTVILVWSEFGRRVAQNQSQGTDHGAAGPVLLLGGGVAPGVLGAAPSLDDLDDGDLRPTLDFRAVYAALLRWLEVDETAVLGARFGGFHPFAV